MTYSEKVCHGEARVKRAISELAILELPPLGEFAPPKAALTGGSSWSLFEGLSLREVVEWLERSSIR